MMLEAVHVVQQKCGTAPLRQTADRALEIEPADRGRYRWRWCHRFGNAVVLKRVGGTAGLGVTPPQVVETVIHRNSIQPGAKARFAAEAPKLPVHVQEDVLQEVLRFLSRPRHPEYQAVEPAGVLPVQVLEGLRVALPTPVGQLEVGGSHAS